MVCIFLSRHLPHPVPTANPTSYCCQDDSAAFSNTTVRGSDHGSLCLTSCSAASKPLVHSEAAVDAALGGGSVAYVPSNEAHGVHRMLSADAQSELQRAFCKIGRCGASSGKVRGCPTLTPIGLFTQTLCATSIHRSPDRTPASPSITLSLSITHTLSLSLSVSLSLSLSLPHHSLSPASLSLFLQPHSLSFSGTTLSLSLSVFWQAPLPPAPEAHDVLPLRAVLRVRTISRELEDISAIELNEALSETLNSRCCSHSRSSSTSGSGSACGLRVVRKGSPTSVQMEHLVARAAMRPPREGSGKVSGRCLRS